MCNHNNIVGDNYGQTCADCGQVLAGYGYWGSAGTCQHQWVRDEDGKGQTCLYCERWEPVSEPEAFPFFAYRLKNGEIHVRRFNQAAMDEAAKSPFVDEVTDRYEAYSRKHAEEIALVNLGTAHSMPTGKA